MHALDAAGLEALDDDFASFRAACLAACTAKEARAGLASPWREQHAAYLQQPFEERRVTPRLLHTELGPGHVWVEDGQVTGLFDFADARLGDPEYDFAAVGLFITRGDAAAFGAFLDGYGTPVEERNPALQDRLLRHALLHRYGSLAWYLKKLRPEAVSLPDLAACWFDPSG